MGRGREQSGLDEAFELFKVTPVWVGPVLAVLVFLFLRLVIPRLLPDKQGGIDVGVMWRPLMSMFSWIGAGAVLVAWACAEIWKLSNRRLLDTRSNLGSIRELSWRDFERLVSEVYRRQGYLAEVVGSGSGDGGVDIRLTGGGETVLVQCKQWRAQKVGVTTVRELLGVVTSERAERGILITSGRFTQEAREFARANRQIELVDGPALDGLVRGVHAAPRRKAAVVPKPAGPASEPRPVLCPACGSGMVLRTARKGPNAGTRFWGCEKYPACRGTRPHTG